MVCLSRKPHQHLPWDKPDESLMACLLSGGLPVASSCNGEGVCGKCRVKIVSGAEHLLPPSEEEKLLLRKSNSNPRERVSCLTYIDPQCIQQAVVEVDTTYW